MAGTAGAMTYHVSIAKSLLLDLLAQHGHEGVLRGWCGSTDEAIAMIEADTRSWFVMKPSCDHQDSEGKCLGHPSAVLQLP